MTETTLVNLVSTWGVFRACGGHVSGGTNGTFPRGAATVLLAGTLAIRSNLSLSMIAVCAALGYCLGGTLIPYYLAKYGGRKLLFKYGRYVFLSTKTLQTANHGSTAMVTGLFVSGVLSFSAIISPTWLGWPL